MRAAFEVVRIFHGEAAATEAQDRFVRLVQRGETDEQVPEITLSADVQTVFSIVRSVVEEETSNKEIRRLIEQGSVKFAGEKVVESEAEVNIPEHGVDIKIGKKRWFRVVRAE
jgi:tyrosyl-tRNA synthetase